MDKASVHFEDAGPRSAPVKFNDLPDATAKVKQPPERSEQKSNSESQAKDTAASSGTQNTSKEDHNGVWGGSQPKRKPAAARVNVLIAAQDHSPSSDDSRKVNVYQKQARPSSVSETGNSVSRLSQASTAHSSGTKAAYTQFTYPRSAARPPARRGRRVTVESVVDEESPAPNARRINTQDPDSEESDEKLSEDDETEIERATKAIRSAARYQELRPDDSASRANSRPNSFYTGVPTPMSEARRRSESFSRGHTWQRVPHVPVMPPMPPSLRQTGTYYSARNSGPPLDPFDVYGEDSNPFMPYTNQAYGYPPGYSRMLGSMPFFDPYHAEDYPPYPGYPGYPRDRTRYTPAPTETSMPVKPQFVPPTSPQLARPRQESLPSEEVLSEPEEEETELDANIDPIAFVDGYLAQLRERKLFELRENARVLNWIEKRLHFSFSDIDLTAESDVEEIITDTRQRVVTPDDRPSTGRSVRIQVKSPVSQEEASVPADEESSSSEEEDKGDDDDDDDEEEEEEEEGEEEDNEAFGAESTVSASTMIRFSVNPQPTDVSRDEVAILQRRDGLLEEIEVLRRELSGLQEEKQYNSQPDKVNPKPSLISWLLSPTLKQLKKKFRPKPRFGSQRIEWICECGEELYADFEINDSEALQQMKNFLSSASKNQMASMDDSCPDLEAGIYQQSESGVSSSQSNISRLSRAQSSADSERTYVGSSGSEILNAADSSIIPKARFLEVCMDTGKYETQLAEILITPSSAASVCTDAHLFRKIYERYFSTNRPLWRRWLYKPVGVRFVHFGVQTGLRVGFFSANPLPPEEQLASKQYEYSLVPPVPPPIDSRSFLHYFWKHGEYAHSTTARYVKRLPKKIGESLMKNFNEEELRQGWGIHILEGPNKAAICWMVLFVLLLSFVIAFTYDLVTKQSDTGFGIGQWVVASFTTFLTAIYFSIQEEVNFGPM